MFGRASRLLLLGSLGGLSTAIAACGSPNPASDTSMFGEHHDSGVSSTNRDGGSAGAAEAGPGLLIIADATVPEGGVVSTTDACPATGCNDATTATAICGDGVIEAGELCDDGNTVAGDGCSSTCQIETGFTCMIPGQACTPLMFCGNGVVDGQEACDDGNTISGDGCSSTCQIETGWQCPVPNSSCTTICGDGLVVGREQCDLGALNGMVIVTASDAGASGSGAGDAGTNEAGASDAGSSDARAPSDGGWASDAGTAEAGAADGGTTSGSASGCSATCTVDPGFACSAPPAASACHATVCGDGIVEGYEQCDDGNQVPYDGCSPTCTLEPKCNVSTGGLHGGLRRRPGVPRRTVRRRQHAVGRRVQRDLHDRIGIHVREYGAAACGDPRHPDSLPRHALLEHIELPDPAALGRRTP